MIVDCKKEQRNRILEDAVKEAILVDINESESDVFYHICPNCTHRFKPNLVNEVKHGLWVLNKDFTSYDGQILKITVQQSKLLHILAKRRRWMKSESVGYQISEAEECHKIVQVQICRLRRYFRMMNISDPI